MSAPEMPAYSRKQWFFAVNLIALLAACGFTLPTGAVSIFPAALVVAILVSWIFLAAPLAIAMRRPAGWVRAALWGAGASLSLAFVGFAIAQMSRWRAQFDPTFNYQLGGGEFVRDIDGVLTPYGWSVVLLNNTLFVVMGVVIAIFLRAILGPGRGAE